MNYVLVLLMKMRMRMIFSPKLPKKFNDALYEVLLIQFFCLFYNKKVNVIFA